MGCFENQRLHVKTTFESTHIEWRVLYMFDWRFPFIVRNPNIVEIKTKAFINASETDERPFSHSSDEFALLGRSCFRLRQLRPVVYNILKMLYRSLRVVLVIQE
jgi:hypothetical protein